MGFVDYGTMVAMMIGLGVVAKRIDPAVVDQLARKSGLTGGKAWAIGILAVGWMFLPLVFGASMDEGSRSWFVGAALSGVGFFVVVMAVSAFDEYRLFQRATIVDPSEVSTNASLVATSGRPTVTGDGLTTTPFTGIPAVHTDWLVQERTSVGFRKTWNSIAGGVENPAFTLGDGTIRVTSGRHRVFSPEENIVVVDPDDDIPRELGETLDARSDLPAPDELDSPVRFIETYVPADESVTVIGTPEQSSEPGEIVIDDAPPDTLLGTHTDHSTSASGRTEAVLVAGDVEKAKETLKRRLRAGVVGGVLVFGGQGVALWVSGVQVL